jgi:hypothetical protein
MSKPYRRICNSHASNKFCLRFTLRAPDCYRDQGDIRSKFLPGNLRSHGLCATNHGKGVITRNNEYECQELLVKTPTVAVTPTVASKKRFHVPVDENLPSVAGSLQQDAHPLINSNQRLRLHSAGYQAAHALWRQCSANAGHW